MWIFLGILGALTTFGSTIGIVLHVKKKHLSEAISKSTKIQKMRELNKTFSFHTPKTKYSYKEFFPELKKYKNNTIEQTISKFADENRSSLMKSLNEIKENKILLEEYEKQYKEIFSEESVIHSEHKINSQKYKAKENQILRSLIKKAPTEISADIWYEYVSPQGRSTWESDHYRKIIKDVDDASSVIEKSFPKYIPYSNYNGGYKYQYSVYPTQKTQESVLDKSLSNISTNQLGHQKEEVLNQLKERQSDEFVINASFKINIFGKVAFSKSIIDKRTNEQITEKRFKLLSSKHLYDKYLYLYSFLDSFEYLETGQQIFDLANEINVFYSDDSHFNVDVDDIISKDPDDIIKTIKFTFSFNHEGILFISSARIGTVDDLDEYFEENPHSRYVEFFKETQRSVKQINEEVPLNLKMAELNRRFLSVSSRFISFEFSENSLIRLFVDVKSKSSNIYIPTLESHFFVGGEEVQSAKYKYLTKDDKPYKAYLLIKKELDKIANSYVPKKTKLFKLLAVLADTYKSTDKIDIKYSDELMNSAEWFEYFDFVPDKPPLNLDELKEGELSLNQDIDKVMRNYQKYAFSWMSKMVANNLSGILADDMGLGKTLETISVIEADKTNLPNLIICPLSLTYNWKKEFAKWAPKESVKILTGRNIGFLNKFNGDKKINIIVSYSFAMYHLDMFRALKFNYVVLDEAQYIKNAGTQRSKGVKKLISNYRFALTGTPIENREHDLWSIFEFLCPTLFDEYKIASLSAENKKRYIKPFILRRRKSEVLTELPEKNEIDITVEMDETQRGVYDRYEETWSDYKDDPMMILSLLTRLRQICISPYLIGESNNYSSPKIEQMFDMVDTIISNNESVLVYSFFMSIFGYIEEVLKVKNIQYVKLTGGLTPEERLKAISEFDNNPDIKVFLISLKAGGVGLNLTKANNVIFLDPWWNIAVENQAADRVHRIGQTKKVNVYRLICANSVEERVIEKQKEKMEIINYFIEDGNEAPLTSLDFDEIKELFS